MINVFADYIKWRGGWSTSLLDPTKDAPTNGLCQEKGKNTLYGANSNDNQWKINK